MGSHPTKWEYLWFGFGVVASGRPLDLLSSSGRQRRSCTVWQVHCAGAHMRDSCRYAFDRRCACSLCKTASAQIASAGRALQSPPRAFISFGLLYLLGVSVSKSDFCDCFFLTFFLLACLIDFGGFSDVVYTHYTYRDIYGDDEEHSCSSVVETPSSAKHDSSCSCKVLLFALRRFSWRVECADLVCHCRTNIC
jgi:hypothetical protein